MERRLMNSVNKDRLTNTDSLPEDSLDVIIIGRNEEENLPRCIQSAKLVCKRLEEIRDIKTRIVYVDSDSTDRSREIARKHNIEVFLAHPDFRTPANGRSSGYCLTSGKLIMFLDGDCELYPDWLVEGIRFLDTHQKTAGVFGIVNARRQAGPRIINIDYYGGYCSEIEKLSQKMYFTGNCLFRREALRNIGGHEPDLIRMEDVFLGSEIVASGWSIYRLPKPMIKHWDIFLRNSKLAIQKHNILVSGSFNRGALLRYARTRGTLKFILPYYKWELLHATFLGILAAIGMLFITTNQSYLELGILAFVLCICYLIFTINRKQSLVFGVTAMPLLTAYVFAVLFGFIVDQPKVRWGVQRSQDYQQKVRAINHP
jgi:glycosyltransferase involved in cell wall biosynthesis